jgi:aspartate kinase
VALAAVLRAATCEIYTDVDGVYTTDPRVMPEARLLSRISYDEMLELASLGAGVMHSRSIEFAKKFGVSIHVRSSLSDTPGTLIDAQPESPDQPVSGAALTRDEARITVCGVPDVPGTSLAVFSRVADRNITVDMIVQNVAENGKADISFTVPRGELKPALEAVREAAAELGASGVTHGDDVAKVSVVGLGMARQTGVADRMFRALADEGVNIEMISTSEIKISVLLARDDAVRALRAVHETFNLQDLPTVSDYSLTHGAAGSAAKRAAASARAATDPAAVVARLQGANMEELWIDDVSLDQSQARVTMMGVPDTPGVAARTFEEVAAAGIFVDMIVQSYGHESLASLTFTVPADKLAPSVEVARRLADTFQCKGVTSSPSVAKLSVSGVGLRSHTGVAIRMFRALSDRGINVAMINTSEVRVNVVVEGAQGPAALEALTAAMADVRR